MEETVMTAKSTYVRFDDSIPLDPVWVALGESWRLALRAAKLADLTIVNYLDTQRRFGLFLVQSGLSGRPRDVTRQQVQRWLIDLYDQGYKATSVAGRFRGLQQFFRWLKEEEEIESSPMARMKGPQLPEEVKRVLSDAEVQALLKTCQGKDAKSRRDLAVISLLFDTGMRRSELSGILLERLDLREQLVVILGKRNRERIVAFGVATARVLDRYLRSRGEHPRASSPRLFLGQRGPLTGDGVYQIVTQRAAQAEIEGISPHTLRHTYAHLFLEAGGQESDLMEQAGWRTYEMMRHYSAALRAKRAREAAKRLSPGDRLGQ